jgi:hypothetical protein
MKSFIDFVSEDIDTTDIKVKKYVDNNGITRSRKIHPHRVDFKNSKSGGEPSQDDQPAR